MAIRRQYRYECRKCPRDIANIPAIVFSFTTASPIIVCVPCALRLLNTEAVRHVRLMKGI